MKNILKTRIKFEEDMVYFTDMYLAIDSSTSQEVLITKCNVCSFTKKYNLIDLNIDENTKFIIQVCLNMQMKELIDTLLEIFPKHICT